MKASDGLSMGDAAAPAGPADEAAILEELLFCAQHFDDAVNDTLHGGANAEPPGADDYNQLMGYIGQARRKLGELRERRAKAPGGGA